MSKKPYQVHPGRCLGPLYLGACLQDILERLKNAPRDDQVIDLTYSSSDPSTAPVLINLPNDGLRLRFDGPEQRLRLIEVLDFTKAPLTYNGHDIFKAPSTGEFSPSSGTKSGPTYRSLTKLLGPTFPREYLPPYSNGGASHGTYVLSYPGVAFSFPVDARKWASDADSVSKVMSSPTVVATTMAVFEGRTWSEARQTLYAPITTKGGVRRASNPETGDRNDEITTVKVHGEGRLELIRRSGPSFWIILSQTTAQDLIAELGAPDAIYRKNDRRVAIHQSRRSSTRPTKGRSSALNDDSEDENPAMSLENREITSAEHFYNYFKLGLDILIAQPAKPSVPSPTVPEAQTYDAHGSPCLPKNHLTATKLLIHGNVPGAWDFDRHRRCQWTLEHVPTPANPEPLKSEQKIAEISKRLKEVFSSAYASKDEAQTHQRGMTLDRGSGASPDSSCELLGGWEEDVRDESHAGGKGSLDTKSELFGFPGMIFEVLKNGAVNCLTVY